MAAAEGERMFQRLVAAAGEEEVEKELYYDQQTGWDLQGLRSDLAVYEGMTSPGADVMPIAAATAPVPPTPPMHALSPTSAVPALVPASVLAYQHSPQPIASPMAQCPTPEQQMGTGANAGANVSRLNGGANISPNVGAHISAHAPQSGASVAISGANFSATQAANGVAGVGIGLGAGVGVGSGARVGSGSQLHSPPSYAPVLSTQPSPPPQQSARPPSCGQAAAVNGVFCSPVSSACVGACTLDAEPSFEQMLSSATPLNAPTRREHTDPVSGVSSRGSWQTVGAGLLSPPDCTNGCGDQFQPSCASLGAALPTAESDADAAKRGRGGWLVDMVDWLHQKARPAEESEQEAPAYVFNEEVRAWIPSGMSTAEWLAQEAKQREEEAAAIPPPPPPGQPCDSTCASVDPASPSQPPMIRAPSGGSGNFRAKSAGRGGVLARYTHTPL